jgi:hypothetical protein
LAHLRPASAGTAAAPRSAWWRAKRDRCCCGGGGRRPQHQCAAPAPHGSGPLLLLQQACLHPEVAMILLLVLSMPRQARCVRQRRLRGQCSEHTCVLARWEQ